MEERELTQLLQQLGDRVVPGAPPVQRIADAGEALRARRSGRVRMVAVAAVAAAVVGGGSVAAVVLDLPQGSSTSAESARGAADDAAGGGAESAPQAGAEESDGAADEGVAAADAVDAVVVTPEVVHAGETVQLTARDEKGTFGLPWRLERLTGQGWTWEYSLVAAVGGREPTWRPADSEPVLEELTVPGPVQLIVPPPAPPGEYRVCQADGTQDRCGRLTVVG